MITMKYLNLTAYKFITLDLEQLLLLKDKLEKIAITLQIKGTILLSIEGINLFVAGKEKSTLRCILEQRDREHHPLAATGTAGAVRQSIGQTLPGFGESRGPQLACLRHTRSYPDRQHRPGEE